MNKETWMDIKGFEGCYKVSSTGRVESLDRITPRSLGYTRLHRGRILTPVLNAKAYLAVKLHKQGKYKTYKIHRLVAEAFIPNPDNYTTVNHINGNKIDNNLENLEWCNQKQNVHHSLNTLGVSHSRIGIDNGKSKLTEQDVREIKATVGITHLELSKKYHVSKSLISAIMTGRSWKHIF